ncbi:MAG: GNAT family N-acetyltransferase [Lachnospiraceae bacterium]
MELINVNETPYLSQFKKLYEDSFPKSEKKPFAMMQKMCCEGRMEMFAIVQDECNFAGLAIFAYYEDLVLLDYFAIESEMRGKGLGSEILSAMKEKFADRRFFLEIESVFEECPDIENRKRRRKFYMTNDMKSQGYLVSLFGVEMEILSAGGEIKYEEYEALYRSIVPEELLKKIKFIRFI